MELWRALNMGKYTIISYCHNQGRVKQGCLIWSVITIRKWKPHHHHTTKPQTHHPPHVPLQLKAIQAIRYYVNCNVRHCITSLAIYVCYSYITCYPIFSCDICSIQHNVMLSVGHRQVLVSNITIMKVFLGAIWYSSLVQYVSSKLLLKFWSWVNPFKKFQLCFLIWKASLSPSACSWPIRSLENIK